MNRKSKKLFDFGKNFATGQFRTVESELKVVCSLKFPEGTWITDYGKHNQRITQNIKVFHFLTKSCTMPN